MAVPRILQSAPPNRGEGRSPPRDTSRCIRPRRGRLCWPGRVLSGGWRCWMSPTESYPAEHRESITLSCPYCTSAMESPSFTVWPSEPRLITGECEGCRRSVTLPSSWLSTPPVPAQR